MEPIEVLSEAVINTLKEFSFSKRQLTLTSLVEALSAREEVLALIHPVISGPQNGSKQGSSTPGARPVRLSRAWTEPAAAPDPDPLSELRNAYLKLLDGLGPVIRGSHEGRFSELQKEIDQCESLVHLSRLGDQTGELVAELINEAVERIDYSNDFLVELSKDLYKMEERLLSVQNHNKETQLQGDEFHDDLLSHASDMHTALDSCGSLQDIRSLITSKISTISDTIETKRQADEVRAREADAKIAELQNNVRTSNQEILQVRERADTLEKEVLLDELTQIGNRRAYDIQIRENLRRYHRNGEQFSLILIDVDHFKIVNDKYGHKAGDICLKEIARLIKTALRKSDFLARYGGEELIAILHGSNARNARNVAEKIRFRIENTRFCYQQDVIPITVSLGVTEALPDDDDPEAPFLRVDEAMYRAKEAGRNTVCDTTDLSLCKIPDNVLPNGSASSLVSQIDATA